MRTGLTLAVAVLATAAAAGACSSRSTPAAAPATATVTAAPSPAPSTPLSSTSPPASTSSPASTSAPTSPSPRTATEPCRAAGLHVTVGPSDGAAGSIYYTIRFANTSAKACTLDGYPGVSVVQRPGGPRIGAAAQEIRFVPRRLVTIAPGASASAYLKAGDTGNLSPACHPATGHWVKVYPPGQFRAQYAHRAVTVCAVKGFAQTMGVSAVRPGTGSG